ncbi:MAG: choice-of-anchor J domain-containing protein, partial [Candidatus Cloacimonadaceae bacterium]|nr:choice-of-anchor J domain-containing protein [Candidatus Cloacimonadaceae bacterium]
TFPPTDWTQTITNTGPAGTTGVMPTWCRVGSIALTPPVPPHSGDYHAAIWWDYAHQDEWLITPQFVCPPSAALNFWSYVFFGSTNQDHYYVKVSTNNGASWTELWDATAQAGGWNYYATPINISLAAYAGQQIKLAFHAIDGPSNDGLWYTWFLDDIVIGSPTGTLSFPTESFSTRSASEGNNFTFGTVHPSRPASRAMVDNPRLQEPVLNIETPSNTERVLLGYKVWRLLAADQANEANWTSLTPTNITPTNYTDTAWGPLPSGVYKYAVKAVYTNNVMSTPAFSNELHKGMMGILTGTVTEFGTNIPIAGATITAGEYSGTSNAQGVYNISVYAGTYTVTCAKPSYQTATQTNVVIVGMQTTTQNFVLTEITLPPSAVQAAIAGSNVNVTWMEPGTGGGEWIFYDSGENNDSIGTGGAADFDVAIRFPASALQEYAGQSLYSLKVWPAQAGTFSLRVWTGGTATAPGTMVVDQPFTPVLDTYNTVNLTTPVAITGTEELWFGYRCNVTTGYPAGCDAGPATNGFGNMIYFSGAWSTLIALAPSLNYNWNIRGYLGYSAPTALPL